MKYLYCCNTIYIDRGSEILNKQVSRERAKFDARFGDEKKAIVMKSGTNTEK